MKQLELTPGDTITRMDVNLYASPRLVTDVSQCSFYHTMDLPEVGTVNGQWDLRGRIKDYLADTDLKGKRVLDIGCASGFLSFEMEKLGATVVSFDAADSNSIAFLPFADSVYTTDRAKWSTDVNVFLNTLKNSYWMAHRLYQSQNKVYYGDLYELPADLGQFDVVVIGQVLIHLKDPISALLGNACDCGGYDRKR
jgi:2-polyprenyl-3-methyl-5-hydroxy-6-metoxy-1,4-benzoquinol methylase